MSWPPELHIPAAREIRVIGDAVMILGDCLGVLPGLPKVDAVVTDPPYELGFMGRAWDRSGIANDAAMWAAVLRTLKPGAHLLAFGGTRTYHRLTCAIEDAGFEVRDCIMWIYGSGFPKSLDVSKAIDREAGAEREIVGQSAYAARCPRKEYEHEQKWGSTLGGSDTANITIPATDAARQWSGWGTALKPAYEPIIVARKPLSGTVAANVQRYGTGAINVDGCRVGNDDGTRCRPPSKPSTNTFAQDRWTQDPANQKPFDPRGAGRWPANLIYDGSEEVVRLFPDDAGGGFGTRGGRAGATVGTYGMGAAGETIGHGDTGSAARFFYAAKASREDREEWCDALPVKLAGEATGGRKEGSVGLDNPRAGASRGTGARNHHPTVKPTDLMRYLCRLVTPPGGLILDPFAGSGSTAKAALAEGFRCVSIELDPEYAEIIRRRARGQAGLPL